MPYGALVPVGFSNVLAAGLDIAVEEDYVETIRMMPNCLASGQVAGTAAALALGRLESRAGEFDAADLTLKRAVALNSADAAARGAAYLALAENAEAKGDAKSAVAYATVVTSLFDDAALVGAAKKILERHPEAKEAK